MIKSKDVTEGGSCFSPAFLLSISFFYHYQNPKEHKLKKNGREVTIRSAVTMKIPSYKY